MAEDTTNCTNPSCGCHTSVFTTDEECPACGSLLRLSGNLQRAGFRLACPHCGYNSPLLSQEQLQALL